MTDEQQAAATADEAEAAPAPAPPTKSRAERLLEEELWYSEKIGDALAFEEDCRRDWERAKDRAKECKELLDGASDHLRAIIKDRSKMADRPILTACEPIEEGPLNDEDDDRADEGPPDWRAFPLAEALSILDARRAVAILNAVELDVAEAGESLSRDEACMGDVRDLFAEGRTILDLDLDDETKVDFLSALDVWARDHDWSPDQEYPDAFPAEYLTTKFHGLEKVVKRVKARKKKAARSDGGEADGD